VRFEVGYYSLKPDIKVIAPWREWDLNSRTKLIAYAGAPRDSTSADRNSRTWQQGGAVLE
jgi:argininosuccinate synthase